MSAITEHKADVIHSAIQRGELDWLDLLCIIEDFDLWVADSDSYVAREMRGEIIDA